MQMGCSAGRGALNRPRLATGWCLPERLVEAFVLALGDFFFLL